MEIQFSTLFKIGFSNNYYSSGLNEDMVVEPTALCGRRLKDYGLLLRRTPEGIKVLYETVIDENDTSQILKPITQSVKFCFTFKAGNPYLLNYSDLPVNTYRGFIYYLHSLNKTESGGSINIAADTNSTFMSKDDLIELRPQLFTYQIKTSNSTAEIEIVDELNNSIYKENLHVLDGVRDYTVDLLHRSPGKYVLKIDGINKLEFYASDEVAGRDILGIIELTVQDMNKKKYLLKVNNRKTYWNYYVVLKYRLRDVKPEDWPADWPDKWSIIYPVDDTTSVALLPQSSKQKVMSDGAVAVPFESGVALPLEHDPVKGIQLKRESGSSNVSKIRDINNLPVPSINNIKPPKKGSNINKTYSDIYIYV